MKKLINKTADFIRESAAGLAGAHADLIRLNPSPLFVYRGDAPVQGKVALGILQYVQDHVCSLRIRTLRSIRSARIVYRTDRASG